MTRRWSTSALVLLVVVSLFAMLAVAGCGQPTDKESTETTTETKAEEGPKVVKLDFEDEAVGDKISSVAPMVGNWSIVDDGGNKVLAVDGTGWVKGTVRPDLATQVKDVWGDKGADFQANVTQFSSYPFMVVKDVDDFSDGEISVRFKTVSGVSDQCCGILFDVQPNGDYLTIRVNPVENNVNFFEMVAGTRNKLKEVKDVPTPKNEWATWKVVIEGTTAKGYLNDKLVFESPLKKAASGKVGIWSKDDSHVLYDDYTVTPK